MSSHGAGVVYHSRMMYLTPEDCVGVSPTKSPPKAAGSKSMVEKYRRQPCPESKLLPPLELMTRPQALRFAYLEANDPRAGIKKMDGLVPKEDPKDIEKREEILKRMREAEIRDDLRKKAIQKKKLAKANRAARIRLAKGNREFASPLH